MGCAVYGWARLSMGLIGSILFQPLTQLNIDVTYYHRDYVYLY